MFEYFSKLVEDELSQNEVLLWAGQPRQGLYLRRSDIFLIPFSLLWGGFAIFWEASVLATGAPFFFKLWGIPFVLVGLYITIGRFFLDAWHRTETHYGVTSERVFIVAARPSLSVKSLPLRTLSQISMNQETQGFGTIIFGPSSGFSNWTGASSWPGRTSQSAPSFEMIADAKTVYEIIRSAQRNADYPLDS